MFSKDPKASVSSAFLSSALLSLALEPQVHLLDWQCYGKLMSSRIGLEISLLRYDGRRVCVVTLLRKKEEFSFLYFSTRFFFLFFLDSAVFSLLTSQRRKKTQVVSVVYVKFHCTETVHIIYVVKYVLMNRKLSPRHRSGVSKIMGTTRVFSRHFYFFSFYFSSRFYFQFTHAAAVLSTKAMRAAFTSLSYHSSEELAKLQPKKKHTTHTTH